MVGVFKTSSLFAPALRNGGRILAARACVTLSAVHCASERDDADEDADADENADEPKASVAAAANRCAAMRSPTSSVTPRMA